MNWATIPPAEMLLLHDDDELPALADEAEARFAARIGLEGLKAIDAALEAHAAPRFLKVARVVADAMRGGAFDLRDEACVRVHVRRLRGLVEAGLLDAAGNVNRPRFSEVKLAP